MVKIIFRDSIAKDPWPEFPPYDTWQAMGLMESSR
jgi:hypothetical protein